MAVSIKNIVYVTPSTNVSDKPSASMEAEGSYKTAVPFYTATRSHIPNDGRFHSEVLKCRLNV
jgi:hypothetical protein